MDREETPDGRGEPQVQRRRIVRSGDGFLHCDDGHTRWGRFGAAGALFIVEAPRGTEMLMQLRSARAHEGGTWSCPGGAMDLGETPLVAALREAREEVGPAPEPWELVGQHTFAPAEDWRYVTSVIRVPEHFGYAANFESTQVKWCSAREVDDLPLHPGFAASWPDLQRIVVGE